MSNVSDFVIERNILKRYLGKDPHVVVPDGVKTIDTYAFRRNASIRTVHLPDSVVKISDRAFQDCVALEQINISQNVKTIGEEAFRNCRSLGDVAFAGEVESMGLLAFFGCWKLAQNESAPLRDFFDRMRAGCLTLEEGKNLYVFSKSKGTATVKEFNGVSMQAWDGTKYPYTFSNRENSLILPTAIGELPVVKAPSKQIPEDAIVYCGADQFDKLPRPNKAILALQWLTEDKMLREELSEKISLFIKKYPDDVVYAMQDCEVPAVYQRFLEIAKPKASLMEKLLEQCSGKAEILAVLLEKGSKQKKAPKELSLDAKPKMTAAELKKLWTYRTYAQAETGESYIELTNYKGHEKHVDIPGAIGKAVVRSVSGTFPESVESVSFPGEDFTVKCSFRNCKAMADKDGFVIVHSGSRSILTDYIGSKDIEVLAIPQGVTENVYGSFRELNMREVILPEGFLHLAGSSFADCRRLQKVTLPESLQTIEQMAFQGCAALSHLYIPESVAKIGVLDVQRTKDPDFTLYAKQGSAAHAYAEKYGHTFIEGKPHRIPMPDFLVKDGILTGYVGSGTDLVIGENVTEIGSFAFNKNAKITSVVIGGQVRVIRSYAFANCNHLSSVTIGGNVRAIEEAAFQFSPIKQVQLEEGVETIGDQAFGYLAASGASVRIPASVTHIGEDAFYSNFGTTTLYGKAGSYAESWAKEQGIPFVAE